MEEQNAAIWSLEQKLNTSETGTVNPIIERFKVYETVDTLTDELTGQLLDGIMLYSCGVMDVRLNYADEKDRRRWHEIRKRKNKPLFHRQAWKHSLFLNDEMMVLRMYHSPMDAPDAKALRGKRCWMYARTANNNGIRWLWKASSKCFASAPINTV